MIAKHPPSPRPCTFPQSKSLFNTVVELDDSFLLVGRLNGARPDLTDFVDGVHAGDLLAFHEVTGQHGSSSTKSQQAVHRHRLRRKEKRNTTFWGLRPDNVIYLELQ